MRLLFLPRQYFSAQTHNNDIKIVSMSFNIIPGRKKRKIFSVSHSRFPFSFCEKCLLDQWNPSEINDEIFLAVACDLISIIKAEPCWAYHFSSCPASLNESISRGKDVTFKWISFEAMVYLHRCYGCSESIPSGWMKCFVVQRIYFYWIASHCNHLLTDRLWRLNFQKKTVRNTFPLSS